MGLSFLTFFQLFFIIHIHLQQADQHAEQNAQKLQIRAGFSHL